MRCKSFTSDMLDQKSALTSKVSVPPTKHNGFDQDIGLTKKLTGPGDSNKVAGLLDSDKNPKLGSTDDTLEVRLRADSGNGKCLWALVFHLTRF